LVAAQTFEVFPYSAKRFAVKLHALAWNQQNYPCGAASRRKEHTTMPVTRRNFISKVANAGGYGAAFSTMQALGLLAEANSTPLGSLPNDLGRGKKVVILGTGIAGMVSRKVKILKRAETMGDFPHAPNGFGKTLRVQFWTV